MPLLNYTNILNTGDSDFSRTKALKTKHWFGSFLDKSMILFNNIVEVFVLADFNLLFFGEVLVKVIQSAIITSALVDCYLIRYTIILKALRKNALAATSSLYFLSKNSMVLPQESIALYK